ncbi:hypothetical protein [Clostridium sp. C8]|uniref:lipopolysaccharide biosynthesis protein n=1 Tax=Clostridium sp. C8 TaxID=1667357 RepID=UPI00062E8653|nr:hypothetical protein [Clostridium sp. C8]KLE14594.1 hypothetical protein AAT22_15800 [Clostridium sp. C8]
MERTKKFFYNSVSSAVLQIITMIVGIIIPRIVLKYYGSEINGLVSSISQFISYFTVVEAGLAGAATYALYKPLADSNFSEVNGIVSAAKKFYTQSGYIFVSLVLGLALIYPSFVKVDNISNLSVIFLVIVLGFNGILEFFTLSKYRVLLTADQKSYVISLASIVQIIINTVIIFILSRLKVDVVIVRAVALISILLRSVILMIYVKSRYNYLNYNVKPNKKALNKRWDALYLQILGSVQTGAPIILATILTNLKSVSIYSIYNMILSGINGILGIFINGLSSSFGDLIVRKQMDALKKAFNEFEFLYYNIVTIVYSISFVTIMPFIKIYTKGITDVNYNLPIVGFLFVLNGVLNSIKVPQGMLVISAGMFKETRIQSTIQALIIIVFGVILTPKYGINGILIASCLSNLYRDIDLWIFVSKKITNLPIKNTLIRVIIIIIEITVVCIPFKFISFSVNNFMQFIILAIIVGIYSTLIIIIFSFMFNKLELYGVLLRLKSIIKK